MATPKPRRGRRVGRLSSPEGLGDLARACPICKAAIGWSCTREVGYQTVNRKTVHPERKVK